MTAGSQVTNTSPKLIPILTMLSRLAQHRHMNDHERYGQLRISLSYILLNHRSSAVRQLAAVAFLVFLPSDSTADVPLLANVGPIPLLRDVVQCSTSSFCSSLANGFHGQLCLLRAWLIQPVSDTILRQRKSCFNWSIALKCLQNLLTLDGSMGSLFLASHLCSLLVSAYDREVAPPQTTISVFLSWLQANASRMFALSSRVGSPELVNALHKLTFKLLDSSPYTSFTLSHMTDANSLVRFLFALPTKDLYMFVPRLLDYWTCRSALLPSNPSLYWRIVDIWSSALIDGLFVDCLDASASEQTLFLLQQLLESEIPGSKSSVFRAKALVCCAACFSRINTINLLPDWWFIHIRHCLGPTCPEPARQAAAEALEMSILPFVSNVSTELANCCGQLSLSHIKQFLSILFFSLFDECSEVRSKMSTIVGRYLQDRTIYSGSSACHSFAACLLLDRLGPSLLHDAFFQWLCETFTIVMKDLNARIVAELVSKKRCVLYEHENANDFCEPRLVLELLMVRVKRYASMKATGLDPFLRKLQNEIEQHLVDLAAQHNVYLTTPCPSEDIHKLLLSMTPSMFAKTVGMTLLTECIECPPVQPL